LQTGIIHKGRLPNCVPSFKSGPVVDKGAESSINTMHLLYLLH